jgi:hypothetical protein
MELLKRHLTFEENNMLSRALEFYLENGPERTLVANYEASCPNNPEKSQIWFDRDNIRELHKTLNELTDVSYKDMVEGLILSQMDDLHDHKSMREVLWDAYNQVGRKIDKIQASIEK